MSHHPSLLIKICACLGAALLVLLPQPAGAQILYGSIVGKITDQSGLTVPGAVVTATKKGTNLSRETVADSVGGYDFPNVIPGTYIVKVTATGFTAFVKTDVPVTINNTTRVDVTLQLGAVTETITVTGETSALQTDRSEMRAEVTSKELVDLPVPGRNYQQLFRALPGFTPRRMPTRSLQTHRGHLSSTSMARAEAPTILVSMAQAPRTFSYRMLWVMFRRSRRSRR